SAPSPTSGATRAGRARIRPASTGRSRTLSARPAPPPCRPSASCERCWRDEMARKLISRQELYDHLAAWKFTPPDQDANRALEDDLWARAGRLRAVLISDMSGFTRITRSRGLLHFLALFKQANDLGATLFERHGGRFLQ